MNEHAKQDRKASEDAGKYNRREYVEPDPLQFLYEYGNCADREIVRFICAGLAYGRVAQIIKSISRVLCRMTSSPARYLATTSDDTIYATFSDFKHRFTTGKELGDALCALKRILHTYGSLKQCFLEGYSPDHDTILPALTHLINTLNCRDNSLVAQPQRRSACKRLNLFLRWMIRQDTVDLGGWDSVSPAQLIIPLDTHMYKLCRALNITSRNTADMTTALEITDMFRAMSPDDPVKYDLTRHTK